MILKGNSFSFIAIRGKQAKSEFFTIMCPMNLIPKLLVYDEAKLAPEIRAQRTLNKARIPEITNYILDNPNDYVFSAMTVSVDGEVIFEPIEDNSAKYNIGQLTISMDSTMLINDGQHRYAAILSALKKNPELGNEEIPIVLFRDSGLKRSQQMFADLNKHAIKPTRSLGILYDYRAPLSLLAKELISSVPTFNGLVEVEKTTISNRTNKLFTLSSIFQATKSFLRKKDKDLISEDEKSLAKDYWRIVSENIPEWQAAKAGEVSCAELRKKTIIAHGIALHAIGIMGSYLVAENPNKWKSQVKKLREIDWSRDNSKLWEGRAMVGGQLTKVHNNIILTANVIKKHIGLDFTPEEGRIEQEFQKGR